MESADQLLDEVAAFFRGKNIVVKDWLARYDARKAELIEEAESRRLALENWDIHRNTMCRASTGRILSPEEKLLQNVFDESKG